MIQRLADQLEKESRDLRVLATVIEHQPIGIVRLSKETGIPEHKVRYSLRMLENDELVEATQQGAVPGDGISNVHHAPIDGIVTDVFETRIDIRFDVCPV